MEYIYLCCRKHGKHVDQTNFEISSVEIGYCEMTSLLNKKFHFVVYLEKMCLLKHNKTGYYEMGNRYANFAL